MAYSNSSFSRRMGRADRCRARRSRRRHSRVENLFVGAALIAVGIVAWGFQQHLDWAEPLFDLWPLILVWIGLGKLLSKRFIGGIALVTGGGLAFLHLRGLADFEYTWPLILVAVGVVVTIGALMPERERVDDASDPDQTSDAATGSNQESDHGPA